MRELFAFVAVLVALAAGQPVFAETADLRPLINALGQGGYSDTEIQINALAATGDSAAAPALEALADGNLYVRKSDGAVFIATKEGDGYALTDPLDKSAAGTAKRGDVEKIKVNNKLRGILRSALGSLTLLSPKPATRRDAAQAIFSSRDPDAIALLDGAIAKEQDASIARLMQEARAAAVLKSDRPDDEKLAAIAIIGARGDRDSLAMLTAIAGSSEGAVKQAAQSAVATVEGALALWEVAQNVWYGLSLGSVLLLAAIGLAITFGVMGVINMAHGEMVMLGAYTTFVVQEIIRNNAPGLFDWSLAIALPLAFLVSGGVGILVERTIIRFLYGRPLETLLATWGLSLILQQAVRTIFGPSNRQVGTPAWMSGATDIGNLTITFNRLWIIVFAIAVFAALIIILKRTSFGLRMRAVTQNRAMAAAMGIRTPWIDALTFGLGSGIAGIAGVALSQIDNVSPNLGQGYIVDSFMVVVFGGVGNLWGTLVGALSLGIANKLLEPYAGAVVGKVLVLIFIILFIQKRPRGLFALRGRAVESLRVFRFLGNGLDRSAATVIAILMAVAVVVPLLNIFAPPTSPFYVPTYAVSLVGKYLTYALLALSVNLVWGFCGILSLGHGAFFALGGYAMGMYLMRQIGSRGVYGDPVLPDFMVFLNWKELPLTWYGFDMFWYAALMVVLVPGVLAFAFGWFAFRSRVTGVYLSIITQAMTYALLLAFFRNNFGFGGNNGLTDFKDILGYNIQASGTRGAVFFASGTALALGFLISSALKASRFGKVLVGVRDAESRTRFLGFRVENYKLVVFVLSAALAGIAGALYVPQVGIINPSEFAPANSIEIVIWVAVGGRGTLIGPIVGAVLVNFAKTWFTSGAFAPYWLFVLGGLFIAVTLFLPKGIVGTLAGLFGARRGAPAPPVTTSAHAPQAAE